MVTFDSIFSSSSGEQRWADQISKNFNKEVAIDISDVPVSVFNVPKALSIIKPEIYIPQVIALGPYHHMRPELYQMERYKVAAIKAFLKPDQILNFHHILIDKLKEIGPTIRACYHKYLDFDDDTLAWIIAIDGLFLLGLLHNCDHPNDYAGRKLTQDAILCRDVMVLENQIPAILLKEIRKALQFSSPNDREDAELFSMLQGLCQAHSPLKLAQNSDRLDTERLHLLDLLYHSIVNHRDTKPVPEKLKAASPKAASPKADIKMDIMQEGLIQDMGGIVDVTLNLGIGGKALRPVRVIRNMPWNMISNLLGLKTDNNLDGNSIPLVEEITIPSVSYLSKVAGIKFSLTSGGIRDIEFDEKGPTFYLPVITLNSISEVILRNLVAYELAISDSTFEFAQYVDLISGIIDTVEDVRLLRENGIIEGDLGNNKIVELFNGMNKSSRKAGYNKTIGKINDYFNKRPTVKVYRFLKNRVYDSWKALTLLSTILLLMLLILQAFCQVYGCPRFFGR